MKNLSLQISVYQFSDYRAFLEAAYHDLHSRNADVSYRWLQKRAGYSVHSNHLWQVIAGRTTLSPTAARRYGQAVGLPGRELKFFVALAAMNQAKSDEERTAWLEEMRRHDGFRNARGRGHIHYAFYEDWYLPALRALVTLEDFREDAAWMAARLRPRIRPRQATSGIKRLIELGFLRHDESGRLVQSEPMIGVPADRDDSEPVERLAVRNYHREMMRLGDEAIEGHPQTVRAILGNTMAVSRRQAAAIKAKLAETIHEIEAMIEEDEPIEVIYRLNMQYFPLVEVDELPAGNAAETRSNRRKTEKIQDKKSGSGRS